MTPTYILGISALYHDSASALIKDGEIVAAAQEERFSRVKGDSSFPLKAIDYCLKEASITAKDLSFCVFYEKPLLHLERLLECAIAHAPKGFFQFERAMRAFTGKKLFLRRAIKKGFGYKGEVLFCEHHQSHCASAFYPSPFGEACILTIDGVGEWATATIGVGKGNKIEILKEMHFPHSLGLLYSAITAFLGFRVNHDEYKVMGLAPYGTPKYVQKLLDEVVSLKEDGSLWINTEYLPYPYENKMTSERFYRLFGAPPRKPDGEITGFHMDMASSLQKVTEEAVLRMALFVKKVTGLRRLCMAGGVALNCVANGKVIKHFDDVFIQPAASDAGGALGCALAVWHSFLERPRVVQKKDAMKGAFLGPSFSKEEVEKTLTDSGIVFEVLEDEEVPKKACDCLCNGLVLGLFAKRMEYGPRALGARSILADPTLAEMQRKLNQKIKFRESFRPFAPAVLLSEVSEYFDFDKPSPYMLLVSQVKEKHLLPLSEKDKEAKDLAKLNVLRSTIPAVTHVDNSARLQTVDEDNRPLANIIHEFHRRKGVPLVVNTSFNVKDEPIVCTPKDAVRCFAKSNMDAMIIENFLVLRAKQSEDRLEKIRKEAILKEKKDFKGEKRFGISLALLSLIFSALCFFKDRSSIGLPLLALSVLLLGTAFIHPPPLHPAFRIFEVISRFVRRALSFIVLAITFFGVVLPTRIYLSLFGKPLSGLEPKDKPSLWRDKVLDKRGKDRYTQMF
jgi:carbamoyltransferase